MNPKHKLLLVLLVIVALVLACDLSPQATQAPPPDSQPNNQDTLATSVQQTLSSSGDSGDQMDQNTVETAVAGTMQAANPTDTVPPPPPPDTQVPPTQEQPTEEPTATLEPTEESPPIIGVKDLNLGDPDGIYKFNRKELFHTYDKSSDGGKSDTKVADGKYVFTIYEEISWSIWVYSQFELTNFYFEIGATMPDNCSDKDRAGFIFGTPPNSYEEGYLYQVSCDGHYRLTAWDGANTTTLIPWSGHGAIKEGPNQTNRIGVYVKNNKIMLFVNAQKVAEINDNMYTALGKVGLTIGVDGKDSLIINFDDAAYWKLP